ncbi:MAG: polyprenyl synthetase family protein, partial [candidate division Zixibacteria bacterium]
GTGGMLGGQMADVEAEGRDVTAEEIDYIHIHKTGMLIRGSVRIGAILAGADSETLARLTRYGEQVGLAFQIIDDILDVEGDQKKLGKLVGSDCKNDKATYPQAVGIEKARERADGLIDSALTHFDKGDENMLTYIARYIGRRES